MKRKIPFVTQIGSSHEDYGCGVAATLMLLRGANLSVESFAATAKGLRVDVLPLKKWGKAGEGMGKGAYAIDVTNYLFNRSVPHVVLSDASKKASSKRTLQELLKRVPVMVGVDNPNNPNDWGDGGHWIVVEPSAGTKYSFLDSARTEEQDYRRSISWAKMARDWDGYAVAVF